MMEYQIRLLSPTGRVAEVYVLGAPNDASALARARILTQTHPEFGGAEVMLDDRVLDEIKGFSFTH
jgi:hypothetical protein